MDRRGDSGSGPAPRRASAGRGPRAPGPIPAHGGMRSWRVNPAPAAAAPPPSSSTSASATTTPAAGQSSTDRTSVSQPATITPLSTPQRSEPPWHDVDGGGDDEASMTSPTTSLRSVRTRHACESCRRRKTKCDGTQPVCSRCRDLRMECNYADNKRERMQRDQQATTYKVELYESLLVQIMPHQDASIQLAIQNALSTDSLPGEESPMSGSVRGPSAEPHEGDEYSATAEAGSPRRQDAVQRDPAGFGPAGFVGKSATARWMEEAGEKMVASTASEPRAPSTRDSIREMMPSGYNAGSQDFRKLLLDAATYHLIDLDLSEVGEYGQHVDAFAFPPRETADALVESYFVTIHPQFPIVIGPVFMAQYASYWQSLRTPAASDASSTWMAMMNLVFALGAIYAHSIQAPWAGRDLDHVQYFIRARMLSLDPLGMLQMPKMEHVQLTAMTGVYLIASHQVNRAWHVVGLSIRYAQSLGLHLKDLSPGTHEAERELRTRVWHSLISLERLLCFLTGRPSSIQDRETSTRLPMELDDQSALALLHDGSSSHVSLDQARVAAVRTSSLGSRLPDFALSPPVEALRAGIELNKIMSDTFFSLYSSETVRLKWVHVQQIVQRLNVKLEAWRAHLPATLRIESDEEDTNKIPLRERMALVMRHLNTSMLINRPSLCEGNASVDAIPSQSEHSQAMDKRSGAACVASARRMISLLPDEPDVVGLYQSTPWWCVLHYLVQAGVVLILEIFFGTQHVPESMDDIIHDVRKLLHWLRAMSVSNVAASRSWVALSRLLLLALTKTGHSVGDLPADLPRDLSSAPPAGKDLPLATGVGGRGRSQGRHEAAPDVMGSMTDAAPETGLSPTGSSALDFARTDAPGPGSAFLSVLTPFDHWVRTGQMDVDMTTLGPPAGVNSSVPFSQAAPPDLEALFPSREDMESMQGTMMDGH